MRDLSHVVSFTPRIFRATSVSAAEYRESASASLLSFVGICSSRAAAPSAASALESQARAHRIAGLRARLVSATTTALMLPHLNIIFSSEKRR